MKIPDNNARHNIVLTDRDIQILVLLSRLRYITLTQLSVLFYGRHDGYSLSLGRARDSLKHRVSQLVNNGYLDKGIARYGDKLNVRAYFLGPRGAKAIQELAQLEQMESPGWLLRRQNAVWSQGAHDLMVNNFLLNLIMLSKLQDGFQLDDWKSSYDIKYYIRKNEKPLIFDPDLFFSFSYLGFGPIPVFLELDAGHVSLDIAKRKILRVLQYYVSGKWRADIGVELFPRFSIIVPDESRIVFFKRAIGYTLREYEGRAGHSIQRFNFYLATFQDVDLFSIDQGKISCAPLQPCWQTSDGKKSASPFLK